MAAENIDSEVRSWGVEGHAIEIEYAVAALEEVCANAVDGLFRFRHGGMEVGGVLFGTADGDRIRILTYRPLDCEHALGPRFVLSERDRTALKELLYAPQREPELRGLEPVGWYHSHTRSDVELCPNDLEIYDSYFPQPWQVALVIRPDNYGPARAGFFFREEDGTVHAQRAYEEFTSLARRHGLLAQLGAEAQPPEEPPAPVPPEPQPRMAPVPPAPSPVAAPNSTAARHEGSLCPNCGALSVHRSHRKGATEHLLAVVGARMRRCHSCNVRFARLFFSNVYMDDARRALRRLALLLIMLVGAGLVILVMLWFMKKQAAIGPSDCLIEPARALTSLPV
jgi:proteasome lid subunit RPN8/RPN11